MRIPSKSRWESTESEGFGMQLHQYMTKTWTQKPKPGDVSMKEQLNDHLSEVWPIANDVFQGMYPWSASSMILGCYSVHPSGFKQHPLENAGRLSLTLRTQEFHYLKRSTSKMHPLFQRKKTTEKDSRGLCMTSFIGTPVNVVLVLFNVPKQP